MANIQEAVRLLPSLGIQVSAAFPIMLGLQRRCQCMSVACWRPQVVRQSRLYESAPAYVTDQPVFLNAALAVRTALPPRQLLDALKHVEVRGAAQPVVLENRLTACDHSSIPCMIRALLKGPCWCGCMRRRSWAGSREGSGGARGRSTSTSSSTGAPPCTSPAWRYPTRAGMSAPLSRWPGTPLCHDVRHPAGYQDQAQQGLPADTHQEHDMWFLGSDEQAPLADLYAPNEASTSGRLAELLGKLREAWAAGGGERSLGSPDLRCVLPLPGIGMWPWQVYDSLSPRNPSSCSRGRVQVIPAVVMEVRGAW